MGRERSRTGQYLHFCTAALILVLAGCAPFRTVLEEREGRAHLQQMRQLTARGNFAAAVQQSEEIIALAPGRPPADAALFSLGLIHADQTSPVRDERRALACFSQLAHDFPDSPYAEQARILAGILTDETWALREGRAHLQRMRRLAAAGDFAGAVAENQRILALGPDLPPADAALFSLGLLFADRNNPQADTGQALAFFTQVTNDFPSSRFAEAARLWSGLLADEAWAQREGRAHLRRMQELARTGDFEGALRENRNVLALAPQRPPGDAALFSLGMLFADQDNPQRDYGKALGFLNQLASDFPASPFAAEAAVWAGVLADEAAAEREGRAHLRRMQRLVREGNFERAVRENRRVLARFPKSPPGDAALFSLALLHVHFANPQKDPSLALSLFLRLKDDFPASPLLDEAQTWIGILERMEQAAQVDLEIEERKKELRR